MTFIKGIETQEKMERKKERKKESSLVVLIKRKKPRANAGNELNSILCKRRWHKRKANQKKESDAFHKPAALFLSSDDLFFDLLFCLLGLQPVFPSLLCLLSSCFGLSPGRFHP